MILSILFLTCALLLAFSMGGFVGSKLRRREYHGVIRMTETNGKVLYSLELADDPEFLANQDEAVFKIIPPEYIRVTSRE